MRGSRFVYAVLLAVALLSLTSPALADDGDPPGLVVGQDFTLHEGEVIEGDLVVVGGDVVLLEGSQVEGDVVIWGGAVTVAGEVDGDVTAFGGDVELEETAEVDGDLSTFGGTVEQEEGAYIGGRHVMGPGGDFEGWPVPFPRPVSPHAPFGGGPLELVGGLFFRSLRALLLILVMATLGGLAMILWPAPTLRVGETAALSLLPALGVGLLTMIVAAVVSVGLVITICLAPFAVLLVLVVGIVTAYGWIGLGVYLGERLFHAQREPFWRAALGVGLLTLLGTLFDLIPCIGWILPFLVGCVGLGAVILTRFGTQPYAGTSRPGAPPPPPVPPAPPAEIPSPEVEEPQPPASRVRVYPSEVEAPPPPPAPPAEAPPELEDPPPPPMMPPASPEVELPPEEE